MVTFILTTLIIALTLSGLAYVAGKRAEQTDTAPPVYALLPGDIKYESPNGNVRIYVPITTSIVLLLVVLLFG